ncbi:hypothetical protein N0V88_000570 [Collariella sp. IMI 366227]|nr:hypothetical protein N0V88_000570 [Collariella sp. IMI 366227]
MVTRMRCEHGEWKTRDQFSNKQLAKYDEQARKGRATPTVTGIRCLEHSSKQSLEMKCQGPCSRRKELHFFSKRTRRNGTGWCIDCTDWQTKSEPFEALPTPGGQLSLEETVRANVPHATTGTSTAPTTLTSLHEDDDVETVYATNDGVSAAPSTRAMLELGSVSFSSRADEEFSTYGGNLSIPNSSAAYRFIPLSLYEPTTNILRLFTAPGDRISIVSGAQTGAVSYNAWGPNGQFARMTKTPTVVSGSTVAQTIITEPENSNRSGWAKAPGRKQPAQLPNYLKYDLPAADDDDDDDDGLDLDSDNDF